MKTIYYLLGIAIIAILAPVHNVSALAIPAYEYGTTILDYQTVESFYYENKWHTYQTDRIEARSDGGDDAPAYALFDFSALTFPVSSAYLSLPVTYANTVSNFMDYIPMLLHDIESVDPFKPPVVWPATQTEYMQSYSQANRDMTSGLLFSEFIVPEASQGTILHVPLNPAAIGVINASMGGTFGIGFGFDWSDAYEGNDVYFESAELNLNTAPAPVPEPGTMLLLISGIGAMSLHLKRKKLRL